MPHELLVVSVKLNAEKQGELFVLRTADGDFLLKLEDLKAMGVRIPEGTATTTVDGETYLPLRALQGLQYQFNSQSIALELQADPSLLPQKTIDLLNRRRLNIITPTQPSGFLNYALQATKNGGASGVDTRLTAEAGLRVGEFLLSTNGASVRDTSGNRQFVRLMSNATRDDLASLQRLVIGDFFGTPGELGNSVGMGGVSLTKLYNLDPYQLRYPLSTLKGQVALPTEVEVIVDGQRVNIEHVNPGTFELRNLYGYGGSRSVQLLLRDAFGRVQQLDYSVYFSDQPLRQGLHEYSYSAGLIRRNYGAASNDYGPGAFSLFHRYGFSDAVTLGLRAEGRAAVQSGGPFGTLVLGTAGVLGFSLSASRAGDLHGHAASLNYNYQKGSFNIGGSVRKDSAGYATLADPLVLYNRDLESSFTLGYQWAGVGAFSLNHSLLTTHGAFNLPASSAFTLSSLDPRRATTLSYSAPLVSGSTNLLASVSHIRDSQGSRNQASLGITVYLDRQRSVRAQSTQTSSSRLDSIQYLRTPPTGEGFGYDLSASRTSGDGDGDSGQQLRLRMATQLNTRAAVLRGEVSRTRINGGDQDSYNVSVAGGIALVDGGLYPTRPISDSFALAKVGSLAGVPVSVNGLPIGSTDAKGQLLIPLMSSYYDNTVSIDPHDIPIDYAVGRVSQRATPLYRSGITVDFQVARMQAFTGRLVREVAGGREPLKLAEVVLRVSGKDQHTLTGQGGELYLENLPPGRYGGHAAISGGRCEFSVTIPEGGDTFIELGDILCR